MASLGLFAGFGLEIEYMIVDRESLDVRPLADRVLESVAGRIVSEVACGPLAWSNELVLHVIELKTNGPARDLRPLPAHFGEHVRRIDRILAPLGARLMPTGMHPWMDPFTETVLWPHAFSAVYERYHAIFDCRGHGWSNLQSTHLNLPFDGDDEFGRLHAAIRLLLPILPALAASSPVVNGRLAAHDDARMAFYRTNSERVPSMAGLVVPEPVPDRATYEREVLERLWRDLAPYDPEGVLRGEFANARGAIARFDRSAIEIRVLDVQECPRADLAVAAAVTAVLEALVEGRSGRLEASSALDTGALARVLGGVVTASSEAVVSDEAYLAALGASGPVIVSELWRHLLSVARPEGLDPLWAEPIELILERGSLARRIREALGPDPSRDRLAAVYRRLCDGLHEGLLFAD